jgi:hypothetical protein
MASECSGSRIWKPHEPAWELGCVLHETGSNAKIVNWRIILTITLLFGE